MFTVFKHLQYFGLFILYFLAFHPPVDNDLTIILPCEQYEEQSKYPCYVCVLICGQIRGFYIYTSSQVHKLILPYIYII